MKLEPCQLAAIAYVIESARGRKATARETIEHVLRMSNIDRQTFDAAVVQTKLYARVAPHFHPDRPCADGVTVAESLLASGTYKSQFETHLSNGSVSAVANGSRDLWERSMFGGAYHVEGVRNSDRPKYGALNLMLHPDGPSPRFGSCYFILESRVSQRCTFTYLDSHQNPREKGTCDELDDIMAAVLTESFVRHFAIGEHHLAPPRLVSHLLGNLDQPFHDPSGRTAAHNLDHYVEAQVHGDIALEDDVGILVADPSFRRDDTGRALEQLCERYAIDLYWHAGFELPPTSVPPDFRGPTMPSLAERVARNGRVDANAIGRAAVDLKRDPAAWRDRGNYAEVLQELKLLWHVLVKYGGPHTG